MNNRLDIIIPTCKSLDQVRDKIEEVEAHTKSDHRLIVTCQSVSASKNRNYGLEIAESPIVIMIDDDMCGFFDGWETKLIEPFAIDNTICMTSARLMNENGLYGQTSADNYDMQTNWAYVRRKVLPSSAIAFINTELRFDETYIGSGFEDTDYCFQFYHKDPSYTFVINNEVELIHLNEMKEQKGDNWLKNESYFLDKWDGKMSPI